LALSGALSIAPDATSPQLMPPGLANLVGSNTGGENVAAGLEHGAGDDVAIARRAAFANGLGSTAEPSDGR
jgi:hypothetical protein